MLMDIVKARHSVRKYTGEQIRREDLEKILEAGNFAPNAGGGQRRKKSDERMGSAGRIRMSGIGHIRIYRR